MKDSDCWNYTCLRWGILHHRSMRRFRLKIVKSYAKPFRTVKAEHLDSVVFSSIIPWLYIWCPRPCRLGMAQHGVEFIVHLGIAQHGGNNVCYQGFHMFVSKISASYLCMKVAGCCFRSSHSAMPSQGGDFLLSRELQETGWGIMLCSPAVLLLTLHSVHWPDSHKPLTWLSREKTPQWFGW